MEQQDFSFFFRHGRYRQRQLNKNSSIRLKFGGHQAMAL